MLSEPNKTLPRSSLLHQRQAKLKLVSEPDPASSLPVHPHPYYPTPYPPSPPPTALRLLLHWSTEKLDLCTPGRRRRTSVCTAQTPEALADSQRGTYTLGAVTAALAVDLLIWRASLILALAS